MSARDPQRGSSQSRIGEGHALVARGVWAVADRGLFALSNFAIHLALARWLPAAEYGLFATAFMAFLLFATFHGSLLSEPMVVFGAGRYRDRFRAYLGLLLKGHWSASGILILCAAAAFACVLLFRPEGHHWWLIPAMLLASPFILNLWFLLRASYVFQPASAAAAGFVYLLFVLPGAYAAHRWGALSPSAGFGTMAGASVVAAIALMLWLRPQIAAASDLYWRDVAAAHWRYGRWSLPNGFLMLVPGSIFYFALPIFYGLEASAGLRALMNLVLPLSHANGAISGALLPVLVQVRGSNRFGRYITLTAGAMAAVNLVYLAVLLSFRDEIFMIVYQGKYVQYAGFALILALVPLTEAPLHLFGSALRALERPDRVFWGYVIGAGVACSIGLLLTFRFEVPGALGAAALAFFCTVPAQLWWLAKLRRRPVSVENDTIDVRRNQTR